MLQMLHVALYQYQFTHRCQVWDCCVVGICSSLPHPVDNELGEVEEDGNLEGGGQQVESHEQDGWSVHDFDREDDEDKEDMSREQETQEDPGWHDMRRGQAATKLLTTSEVTAEDSAGITTHLLILVWQCTQETVCHLVKVCGHPRGLNTN